MSAALARLQRRRQALVAQAALERRLIARDIEPWRKPLALADRGVAVLAAFRRHPLLVVGTILLLSRLPIGRGGRWLQRAWVAWRIVRGLRGAG